MKNFKGCFYSTYGFLLCLYLPAAADATTAYALDFETLSSISERIVVARVSSVFTEAELKPRQIETVVQLEVKECLKGPCDPTLELRQLGGTYQFTDGAFTQKVPGLPNFQAGERVVLFLERADSGRLVVTGLAQGKLTVVGQDDDSLLVRDLSGLNLLPPTGKFYRKTEARVPIPTRLDMLRASLGSFTPILDIRTIRIKRLGGSR